MHSEKGRSVQVFWYLLLLNVGAQEEMKEMQGYILL